MLSKSNPLMIIVVKIQKSSFCCILTPLLGSAIIHKIFETDTSFHVKQRTTRNIQILLFRSLLVLKKCSFGRTKHKAKILWSFYSTIKKSQNIINMIIKFFFHFLSLLTALIVKNSHILAGICYIFLKNILDQTWKASNTKFGPQWKDQESTFRSKKLFPETIIHGIFETNSSFDVK